MTPPAGQPWYRQLPARMAVDMPLKAFGTTAFMAAFFCGYFVVLRNPLVAPVTVPLTAVDHWIEFTPGAFAAYVSLWVYVSLPPAFLTGRRTLYRFGAWIAALCILCLLVFWVLPTRTPPFPLDISGYPSMNLIKGIDAAGNACPSLHVASAVFAAFWLDRLARAMRMPSALRWISATECALILWSTMATRQHVFLDVIAGLMVGAIFAVMSLRHADTTALPGEIREVR